MRSLLLFSRFCTDDIACDNMKPRIDTLRACLPSKDDYEPENPAISSRTEAMSMSKIVARLLPGQSEKGGCTVETGVYLDGCFGPADIVITKVTPDGIDSVYNIEVDGPSHDSLLTAQRLSGRRDQHLQEACGVRIARIPLVKATGEGLQGPEYEGAVREVLVQLGLLQS
jgi:hypothetical protein